MPARLISLACTRCRSRSQKLSKVFGSSGAFAMLHGVGGQQAPTLPSPTPGSAVDAEPGAHAQTLPATQAIEEPTLPLYSLASPSQGTADFLKWWYATRLGGAFDGSGKALHTPTVLRTSDSRPPSTAQTSPIQARLDGDRVSPSLARTTAGLQAPTRKQGAADENADSSISQSTSDTAETAKASGNHISNLMSLTTLYEPIRKPRHPIVLLHGLGGFDKRGLFFGLEIHYWATVLDILRKKIGADIIVKAVPGAGSIKDRANALHKFLCTSEAGVLGKKVNLVAHSMGGLDARHLITNIRPTEYEPISLTTLSTPHRGSPFMDWCNANVGVGNDAIEQAVQEARQSGALPDSAQLPKVPYTLKTPIFVKPKKTKGDSQAKAGEDVTSTYLQASQAGIEAAAELGSDLTEKVDEKLREAVEIGKSSSESREQAKSSSSRPSSIAPGNVKAKAVPKENKTSGIRLPFSMSAFTNALSTLGGSFSSYMLSVLDQPAYAMLSTKYMTEVFNPSTPDSPRVQYYSIAARTRSIQPWHPLWLPKLILDAAAESRTGGAETDGSGDALGSTLQGNDGLVSVQSARWGHFLGVVDGCDHWDLRGGGGPRWGAGEKINYATGKPWEADKSSSQVAAGISAPAAKVETPKPETSSWIDINRLLDVFTKSKKDADGIKKADPQPSAGAATSTTGNKQSGPMSNEAEAAPESSSSFLEHYAAIAAPDDVGMLDTARPWHSSELGGMSKDSEGVIDSGIVSEVAEWISERLPQRDEGRRAQAERAADAQDALAEASLVTGHAALTPLAGSKGEEHADEAEPARLTLASTPTWSEIRSAPPEAVLIGQPPLAPASDAERGLSAHSKVGAGSPRLKRDPHWEASLDQNAASRELRRELAWHRAERARSFAIQYPLSGDAARTDAAASLSNFPATSAVFSRRSHVAGGNDYLDWDAHSKRKPGKEATKEAEKEKRRQTDQLERFWLAVCLHLYQQGH